MNTEEKEKVPIKKEDYANFNHYFKLPIYYNKDKMPLKSHIANDLELVRTLDASCVPIYHHYFKLGYNDKETNAQETNSQENNDLTKETVEQMAGYYTTDVSFLKDNQRLLKEYKSFPENNNKNYTEILELWKEIKTDTGFREKYYYIDWDQLEFLNQSEWFLQFMSIYNLMSPIISLLIPIFIMIIPFLLIKMKGLEITFGEYAEVLKFLLQSNAIGKLFTTFNDVTINDKIYLIVSAAFYLFSIYQNVMVCIRFNCNMRKIHKYFDTLGNYLTTTILKMENYLLYAEDLSSQRGFTTVLKEKKYMITYFRDKLRALSSYSWVNIRKCGEIGTVMKYFYELYNDPIVHDSIMYSFGFNGYIDCLEGLQRNIEERKIGYAEFVDSNKKTVFKNNYYASLKDSNPVKNTVRLKKNIIITGPNASGKTTVLKSTLINLLFTQQFGVGFYDSAQICPFHYIHCYLNIPDTSGRDSLFQAEARRCKEILDVIHLNKQSRHFCVFDELYSGTNPEEAVSSATAFMEYIVKNKNMSCLLTTHFVKVCKKLKKNDNVMNCHMESEKVNDVMHYKYKLKPGISLIKGGISVLKAMDYPKELLIQLHL